MADQAAGLSAGRLAYHRVGKRYRVYWMQVCWCMPAGESVQ